MRKFLNIIYVWFCYYYWGYLPIISVQYQIINYCQHKAIIISFCPAQPQLMPGHSHTQAFLRLLASWHLVGFVMYTMASYLMFSLYVSSQHLPALLCHEGEDRGGLVQGHACLCVHLLRGDHDVCGGGVCHIHWLHSG